MRERRGWQCENCGTVTLEYRRKRPSTCPWCPAAITDSCRTRTVIQLDASDFPKKPRCLPGQMDLFESARAQLENERAAQDELPAPFTVEE